MKRISVLSLAVLFSLWTSLALALSPNEVERYITSVEQIIPLVDEEDYDDDEFDEMAPADFLNVDVLARQHLTEVTGRPALERVIRDNRFASSEAWANVGARVQRAFFALAIGAEFEASLEEIRALRSEAGPEEQAGWEQVEQQIITARDAVAAVPKSDLDAVRPYLERLQALFELDDDDWDETD